MKSKFVVTVAGNMGVGKSTLTRLISEDLGWTAFYEATDNPYLSDFYDDMHEWSFNSQLFFLSRRLTAHRQMMQHPQSVIQDRSIYEDAEVFARNLRQCGHITERDYNLYRALYDEFIQFLPIPDLVIYLKASVPTLIGRIQKRGHDFERDVSPLYLQQLNELYNGWIEDFTLCPILVVPADHIDFVRFKPDFNWVKEQILLNLKTTKNNSYQPLKEVEMV